MPGLVTTNRNTGFNRSTVGGSAGVSSGLVSGGGSKGASNQLASNRQSEIDKILKLFQNFGVSAKQDIQDVTRQRTADIEVDAINRGLGNLTVRQPLLGDAIRQGKREERRVDETVASQEAQFRASQLIDPALIAQLTQGAAAAGSGQPIRTVIPAGSSSTRPNLADSIRNQGRGGGSVNSTNTSSPGISGGTPGTGARIVTRNGSFTPQEFGQQQGQGPAFNPNQPQGGTQQPQTQPGVPRVPTQPTTPEGSSQAFTPDPKGQGTQTVTVEHPSISSVPGVVSKLKRTATIPAGMSIEQAIAEGFLPRGSVKVN